MPVISVIKDPDALTLTVVAEFPAPVGRLWNAYIDPRQLERFWGPPTYPATFTRHDVAVGGRSEYAMTGPEGDTHRAYWEWLDVQPGKSFEVLDGFAGEDGTPAADMPLTRMVFTFEPIAGGSRVTTTSHFVTADDLEKLLAMGMDEGMRLAMSQMDGVIADVATFAADIPTLAQTLSDTQVRISRVIRGPVEAVWRAYHEPELLQRWLLGPDGWTMPVCEVASQVGDSYRYEWEQGDQRFGFVGELLETSPPHREVTTERMIGVDGETTNELTLTAVPDGTLMTLIINYPSAEIRDIVLATGMTDGMETSFRRMETEVLPAA